MTDETLYTLRQLADELKLPESTVRYYRDAYLDHIPSVGTGRRRRYPASAVAVLRSIARSYAAGRTREQIAADVRGQGSPAQSVSLSPESPARTVPLEEVSNLDLLAAILDGEREQRDALWQMAKEIVRLTGVLEGQDAVLNEIADRAGVIVSPSSPRLAAAAPKVATLAAPASSAPAASASYSPPPAEPSRPVATPAAAPAPPAPPPVAAEGDGAARHFSDAPDIDRLRAELESERALVERLRESKLELEHRAADAEAALEDRGKRRSSVIRRLLGSEPGA